MLSSHLTIRENTLYSGVHPGSVMWILGGGEGGGARGVGRNPTHPPYNIVNLKLQETCYSKKSVKHTGKI